MDENYTNLPSSHLLGSVPAAVTEDKRFTIDEEVPDANMHTFPPNGGADRGQGYQSPGGSSEEFERQPATGWKGVFSISSYTEYFNVDTDIVLNRMMSSLYPSSGDFFSKIEANPDLYGLIWISTTLVFVLASLGNCAAYLMEKEEKVSTWSFDVGYFNMAAGVIYGYAIVVPVAYYFLLQYLGSTPSLVRFWCLWGYSLSIFVLSSFLLVIPVEFIKWVVVLLTGAASAYFVALNLKSYIQGNDQMVLVVSSFCLQMALAIFVKVWFFA